MKLVQNLDAKSCEQFSIKVLEVNKNETLLQDFTIEKFTETLYLETNLINSTGD